MLQQILLSGLGLGSAHHCKAKETAFCPTEFPVPQPSWRQLWRPTPIVVQAVSEEGPRSTWVALPIGPWMLRCSLGSWRWRNAELRDPSVGPQHFQGKNVGRMWSSAVPFLFSENNKDPWKKFLLTGLPLVRMITCIYNEDEDGPRERISTWEWKSRSISPCLPPVSISLFLLFLGQVT